MKHTPNIPYQAPENGSSQAHGPFQARDCVICGYHTACPAQHELGAVRGNTERFMHASHRLWKCPACSAIHSLDQVDFKDIYSNYPLNRRRLDIFARGTLRNLLKRLRLAGVKKNDSILDYGCGNGVFIAYLKEKGYAGAAGYDPYVPEFSHKPGGLFDCVVANDVLEHVPDPRRVIRDCAGMLKPGGLLYVGTADSEGVDMRRLEPHVMRLHQPFHRVIITGKSLQDLGRETGMELIRAYRRSYMDTLMPFANYRFLDEFSKALGHNMDSSLDPAAARIILKRPALLFYALFGYFRPSAFEPAILLRKPARTGLKHFKDSPPDGSYGMEK